MNINQKKINNDFQEGKPIGDTDFIYRPQKNINNKKIYEQFGITNNYSTNNTNGSIHDTNNNNNRINNYLQKVDQNNVGTNINTIRKNLINSINTFNRGDIVDKIRLKMGGTADLDTAIQNLEQKRNTSRAELLQKYKNIIDPVKREALINQEERNIDKQINDLYAIKKYRLGNLNDIISGEIADQENKIRALEYQYKIAKDMMGDYAQAEKIKKEQEKTAIDLQKKYIEMQKLQQQMQYYQKEKELDLKNKTLQFLGNQDKYGYKYEEVPIGDFIISKGQTNNIPDRNNNPGNLKMGDIGYGVDKYGHTIFNDPKQGFEALIKDIEAKKTGKTRTGLNGESTLADLGKVYAEDPNWATGVSKLSGYGLNTKLKDIDTNKLAYAIAKQEGFTGLNNKKQGVFIKTNNLEKIATVEDYINNKNKYTTKTKILQKIKQPQIDSILKDNIGKWKLNQDDENTLMKLASPDVLSEYKKEKNNYTKNKLIETISNSDDNGVINIVEKLKAKKLPNQEIWNILKEAGVLDRDYFDDGIIWDSTGFDKLQKLIGDPEF